MTAQTLQHHPFTVTVQCPVTGVLTALMDRAGLTPAYAIQVRHRDDQQALETTEHQDPEVMARQILAALPQVMAMLPPTEVRAVLQRVELRGFFVRVFAPFRAPGAPESDLQAKTIFSRYKDPKRMTGHKA